MENKKIKTKRLGIILGTIIPICAITGVVAFATPIISNNFLKKKIIWENDVDKYLNGAISTFKVKNDLEIGLSFKDEYKGCLNTPKGITVKIGEEVISEDKYTWTPSEDFQTANLNIKGEYLTDILTLNLSLVSVKYKVVSVGDDYSLWTDIPKDNQYAVVGKPYSVDFEVSESGKEVSEPGVPISQDNVSVKIGGVSIDPDTWKWKVITPSSSGAEGVCDKARLSFDEVPSNLIGNMEISILKKR